MNLLKLPIAFTDKKDNRPHSESETITMANAAKIRFLLSCREDASLFSRVLKDLREKFKVWTDRGYQTGGADPIVLSDYDTDTTVSDLSLAEIAAFINAANQFGIWANTGSPTTENAMNQLRNDI